jgi:hypothetical protein
MQWPKNPARNMKKLKTELQRRSSVFRGRNGSKDSQNSDTTSSSPSQPETPGTSSPEMEPDEVVFSPSTSISSASPSHSDMFLDRPAEASPMATVSKKYFRSSQQLLKIVFQYNFGRLSSIFVCFLLRFLSIALREMLIDSYREC